MEIIIPNTENILLFVFASFLLAAAPGPAVLYIMTKSMVQGYKAGVVSVVGIGFGGLVHVVAAAFGVSALIMASATAFAVLKYLGAFYLIYLGVVKLMSRNKASGSDDGSTRQSSKSIFYEGVIVNALNPKTAMFFLAFLPQFVDLSKGGVTSQIIFLGMTFIAVAVLSDTVYVLISGRLGKWVKQNPYFDKIEKTASGLIYILLGLSTLSIGKPAEAK